MQREDHGLRLNVRFFKLLSLQCFIELQESLWKIRDILYIKGSCYGIHYMYVLRSFPWKYDCANEMEIKQIKLDYFNRRRSKRNLKLCFRLRAHQGKQLLT